MMTETFTTFLRSATAAAALVALLPAPEVQAQFSVYYGGKMVYAQKTGMPDSAQFVFNVPEVKASQECDPSTVGGTIAKTSEAVDLGLSSGTLWAPWNVGATSPGEGGAYFAWGEVQAWEESWRCYWDSYYWVQEGKSDWQHITKYQAENNEYEKDNVLWYDFTGKFVGDGKTTLEASDDAATVNWGGKWRMPTPAEFQELSNNCTWEWKAKNEYAEGSLAGYLVTGSNGNSIFLPAHSDWWASVDGGPISPCGRYWSSELSPAGSDIAIYFDFLVGGRWPDGDFRYRGMTVRAVRSATE